MKESIMFLFLYVLSFRKLLFEGKLIDLNYQESMIFFLNRSPLAVFLTTKVLELFDPDFQFVKVPFSKYGDEFFYTIVRHQYLITFHLPAFLIFKRISLWVS